MRGYRLSVALLATTALPGCMTMGGNVKGSFACVAPEGICAPSSVIDDRALTMISGEDGDRLIQPAGPSPAPPGEGRAFSLAANGATRTREKVLRIVFPAHIDAAGRLHEQTAVHAVVDAGDWRQAAAGDVVATSSAQVAEATGGTTLLAAVESADAVLPTPGVEDPDLPSAAVIDAARAARANGRNGAATADPIGAIKHEVAGALAAPPRLSVARSITQGTTTPTGVGRTTTPATPTTSRPSPASSPATSASPSHPRPASPTAATTIPAQATPEGRRAVEAIGANPVIRSATARVEQDARAAKPAPTVRAPSFPGIGGAER